MEFSYDYRLSFDFELPLFLAEGAPPAAFLNPALLDARALAWTLWFSCQSSTGTHGARCGGVSKSCPDVQTRCAGN